MKLRILEDYPQAAPFAVDEIVEVTEDEGTRFRLAGGFFLDKNEEGKCFEIVEEETPAKQASLAIPGIMEFIEANKLETLTMTIGKYEITVKVKNDYSHRIR